jgi:hypothetical protein
MKIMEVCQNLQSKTEYHNENTQDCSSTKYMNNNHEIMTNCPTNWVIEQELLLKDWAEKARYYSWMHNKAGNLYIKRNNNITIPLIIISTVSGSANFSMVGVQTPYHWLYTVAFPLTMGILSITAAILSAMAKYLRTAELSENHQEFHKKFNSLFRNISLELSLPANQRKSPAEICNLHRFEFDRLVSEAPNIPEVIINKFNSKFPFVNNKPEITHSFDKVVIYGRNQALRTNYEKLLTIRNFYKFVYSTKLLKTVDILSNKASSTDIESKEQTSIDITTPTNQIRKHIELNSTLYEVPEVPFSNFNSNVSITYDETEQKTYKQKLYSSCIIT